MRIITNLHLKSVIYKCYIMYEHIITQNINIESIIERMLMVL